MKKFVSMFLALVMALALTIPAMASSGTVKVDGSIQVPTLNVVLPTTASMIMNPYNMTVKLDPKDATKTSTDQIISPTMEVKNLSNIGIQVGISVSGTTGKGDVTFAASSAAASTTKEAYIYVAFEIGDTGLDVTDTNGTGNETVVLSTTAAEPTTFATTVAAASGNTLAASTDAKTPATNGVLGFKFFGDTGNVTTWTDKDTLGASIAFTFTPVAVDTTPAVAISGVPATIAASDTFNLTATPTNLTGTVTYSWAVSNDNNNIIDSFTDGAAATQAIAIAAGATTGQTADVTVTATYGSSSTVTDTVTITIS